MVIGVIDGHGGYSTNNDGTSDGAGYGGGGVCDDLKLVSWK